MNARRVVNIASACGWGFLAAAAVWNVCPEQRDWIAAVCAAGVVGGLTGWGAYRLGEAILGPVRGGAR